MTSADDGSISVLLVADPGLPTRRAQAVQDDLQRILGEVFSPPVQVHIATELVKIDPDNELDFSEARALSENYDRVDVTLLLTEIPRHTHGKPLMAEIFPDQNIGVLSCPTFGAWTTRRRILRTLVDCVIRLSPTRDDRDPSAYGHRWASWSESDSGSWSLHADTFWGGPRTVFGMVRANDPWRTVPKLSSALAAASATGAFGIFYHSIWQMSDALSTPRLLFIGLLAMVSMGSWLMVGHRLWDRPKHQRFITVVLLYNMSTLLTIAICMLALYACLVILILIGSLVVIDPDFMSGVLGHEAAFTNYLDIAWLSAAMGTVAGALGSSFDSSIDLRQITHGQRERQRTYSESYSRDRGDGTRQ